jgi:hypothetical protein
MDINSEINIIRRYARYFEVIEQIRNYRISENITVRKLKMRSGIIKTIYDDIKKLQFPGDAIEFLCFVDFQYHLMLAIGFSWNLKELITNFEKNSSAKNMRTAMRIYGSNDINIIARAIAMESIDVKYGKKSMEKLIPMMRKFISSYITNEMANEETAKAIRLYMKESNISDKQP